MDSVASAPPPQPGAKSVPSMFFSTNPYAEGGQVPQMDSVASAPPPQTVEKSVRSISFNLQRIGMNMEGKILANVAPSVSRSRFRVGAALANGKTEFDKSQIANGVPNELKAVSRNEVVDKDGERLLVGKVSERVRHVAKFNWAKLADLEIGDKEQSSSEVFTDQSTVVLPHDDLDRNKVEMLARSDNADVGSSTLPGCEEDRQCKENIISGLQKVFKVPVGKLVPANPDILEAVDDLVQLSYLNDASVLCHLQHRYAQNMIYTKAGPILVAINPFKDVPLYGNDFLQAYRLKTRDTPHVYGLADDAFEAMMKDGVNQCIIISGESGAGKTETSKIAMQYLVSLGDGNGVENEILQTNPILEAFGNAKTLKNNNSSRFGKLIDIHFDESRNICGAKIHTYLLEKSRVVQRAQGERSYHIFYQICAGASPALREQLNLQPAKEYYYLNQSNCLTINEVDDAERFHAMMGALNKIQISLEDQENAFAMLATVLWLGNITFSLIDDENHVRVDNNEAARNVAKLLGCGVEELMVALSTRKIYAGNEDVVQNLTCSQAVDTRDALAKAIYSYLFDWLVDCINNSLEVGKCQTRKSISILDIYGFESFDKNSFEQLCINYANERLQQHFIHHMFKLEQEEYSLEGIDWTEIEFEDNQECLDLIETKPLGLISLLDEESTFPKGTDLTLASKLEKHLRGNCHFKGKRGKAFSIYHYAGEVLYDTTGFLEKNRDMLGSNLLQLLSSCTSQLPQLFVSNVTKGSQTSTSSLWRANGKESHRQTIATKFKGQLFNLMQFLENTSPHFIRCIKPNKLQLPGFYEQKLILQQLHYCGVLEVVRISRFGYPSRMTHKQFAKRYGILLLHNIATQDVLNVCIAILHLFKIPPEMYRVGFTKLFFRGGQIGKLEYIRKQTLCGILRVQKAFRGHKVRCHFKELQRAAIFLQSLVRCALEWKQYQVLKERHQAAVAIQKEIRRRTARQKYMKARSMVILVQAVIRGWLARNTAIMQQQSHEVTSSTNMLVEGSTVWANVNEGNIEAKLEDRTQCIHEANENIQAMEMKFSEDLDPEATIRIQLSFFKELQKRLLVAEAAITAKEDENAALHQRLQQYEVQWPGYKGRMVSMEEVWKKQTTSLQMTLSTAKKSLTDGAPGVQQANQEEAANFQTSVSQHDARHVLPNNDDFNLDDSTSGGTKTPDHGNSTSKTFPRLSIIEQAWELNSGRSIVSRLVEEFEHRAIRKDDSKFSVEVRSQKTRADSNPVKEIENLKHRFDVWKKDFKVHLHKIMEIMQKLGSPAEKSKKKWWRKRSG